MPITFVCFWCEGGFTSNEELKQHIKTAHKPMNAVQETVASALLTAEFCRHYCCGMSPKQCLVVGLERSLQEYFDMKLKPEWQEQFDSGEDIDM